MKILALADGSSSHITRYVTELRRQGADVYLASFQKGDLVDCLIPARSSAGWRMYYSARDTISELIRERSPDIVNAHFASAYGYSAARCRKKYGRQGAYWALTVWGSDILISPRKSFLHKARVKSALRHADMVLADSSYLVDKSQALGATRTRVIPWGIEESELADDTQLLAKANWPANEALRALAPRPHRAPYNNESLLSPLAPLLKEGGVTLETTMDGDCEKFKAASERNGVSGAVKFYPRSSRAEYLKRLSECRIMLSASLSDSSPVSVIEALAVGTLPLVADIPGVRDIIPDGLTEVCLYSLRRDGELLNKFSNLREMSFDERLQLLQAGRDHIARVAVYEKNIADTLDCFEALMSVGND